MFKIDSFYGIVIKMFCLSSIVTLGTILEKYQFIEGISTKNLEYLILTFHVLIPGESGFPQRFRGGTDGFTQMRTNCRTVPGMVRQ